MSFPSDKKIYKWEFLLFLSHFFVCAELESGKHCMIIVVFTSSTSMVVSAADDVLLSEKRHHPALKITLKSEGLLPTPQSQIYP